MSISVLSAKEINYCQKPHHAVDSDYCAMVFILCDRYDISCLQLRISSKFRYYRFWMRYIVIRLPRRQTNANRDKIELFKFFTVYLTNPAARDPVKMFLSGANGAY